MRDATILRRKKEKESTTRKVSVSNVDEPVNLLAGLQKKIDNKCLVSQNKTGDDSQSQASKLEEKPVEVPKVEESKGPITQNVINNFFRKVGDSA
jgi:hypothetical protein